MKKLLITLGLVVLCAAQPAGASGLAANGEAGKPVGGVSQTPDGGSPEAIIQSWYRLMLELVRHTATYSPPYASRTFGLVGVAVFETSTAFHPELKSLAGQLNALTPPPLPEDGVDGDEAAALHGALRVMVGDLFGNTGPTGQRVLTSVEARLRQRLSEGKDADQVARSLAHGEAVARHVLSWSADDGGAVITNLGFPESYTLKEGPAQWVPTSTIGLQQTPLLPHWGENRPFVMPSALSCPVAPPPAYSEEPGSDFFKEAMEVRDVSKTLTDDQKAIARFWSDDAMLSPTPPGHWISIALQLLEEDNADAVRKAEVLARLGIGLADSFIANWHAKYHYDLLRPVTYLRRLAETHEGHAADRTWEPLLITPPFPEYPSGHSTQSGAAAGVLTHLFGDDRAFEDHTHKRDKLPSRSFANFSAAADEAAMSRLYGGIHFRSAIVNGVDQGVCVSQFANALDMRK